jgi:hypothetical protein
MKKQENKKMYYFVDESGDPNFLGKGKVDLVETGKSSQYFIVGYAEIEYINALSKKFSQLRDDIRNDEYLNQIPSVKSSLKCFHANKDSREVQERVFRILHDLDFTFFAVVIEKKTKQFLEQFGGKRGRYYAYIVERLFENRLHLYKEIDIYFAKFHNVIHDKNMWNALENAKDRFSQKWNHTHENDIRIFMQNPSQIVGLQVADYCLWSLHRVYHHKDFRYYHYLQDKISLVHDLSYGTELYGTYFNKNKPITKGRFGIKK